MDFTYDLVVDPEADNNTHAFALGMIGYNKRVLEVGSATGYFTKVLSERGCKVVGMELDPDAAQLAEQWAERVVVGNVEEAAQWDQVDDESFDVVTFGDVLEHLRDPLAILRKAMTKLKPEGFVVTSLPNVAHGDARLALLHGSFEYRDTGLLDRTHLRFFTIESVRQLLYEAGLVVVDTRRVVVPLFHTEFGLVREDYPEAVVEDLKTDPDVETYQFVMKSVIDNGSQAVADLAGRLAAAADRIRQLEVQNQFLQDRVTDYDGYAALREEHIRLNEQVASWVAHVDELNEKIAEVHEELHRRADEVEAITALAASYGNRADELRLALEASEQRYEGLRNSRSLRVTAPLRRLAGVLRAGPGH
jgi:SAM-dependent methyltransferase